MNYCKKCGSEIKENAKFCSKCGSSIESSYIGNEVQKVKKVNFKIIIPVIAFMILIAVVGGLVFMKITTNEKQNMKKSIEILSVNTENYPNIVISMKANNYQNKLEAKGFTIKENDTFQKDLKLLEGDEKDNYNISYKTSDESTSGERTIKLGYLDGSDEVIAEYNYKTPEKKQSNTKEANSNNVVNTYDNNELAVKQALDDYENSYIRMINSKDIYYIKSSIDLSGGLINEFTDLIKSYKDQEINEDLLDHKIEEIKKISDLQYEITVYEKYYISYGKQKKSTYTDYRINYIISKTNSGFKVYSIKNIATIGSKTNP